MYIKKATKALVLIILVSYYAFAQSWYNPRDSKFDIYNLEQLKELQTLVNNGDDNFERKTINLTRDIVINENWIPIGNVAHGFRGIFDGNNHTISNVSVNGKYTYAGLFGVVSSNGQIKNLNIRASKIKTTEHYAYAGGLVGFYASSEPIEDCTVVVDSIIASAKEYSHAGGLIGSGGSGLKISKSYAVGNIKSISSKDAFSGGLVGGDNGGVYAGEKSITVSNSYTKGTVGSFGIRTYSGGLIGSGGNIEVSNSYSISNVGAAAKENINVKNTKPVSYAGGLIGYAKNDLTKINNAYADGYVSVASFKVKDKSRWYRSDEVKFYKFDNDSEEYYKVTDKNEYPFEEGAYAGGIFGYNRYVRSSSVYYNSAKINTSSGIGTIQGILSKNLNELRKRETFIYWDFNSVWDIEENNSSPKLKNLR